MIIDKSLLFNVRKYQTLHRTHSKLFLAKNIQQGLFISSFSSSSSSYPFLKILPEVSNALSADKGKKKPVVALESTIIAHGMPHPTNLELMNDVSQILRSKGVIPATIAIKNNIPHIGLTKDELIDLSLSGEDNRSMKVTTRDLPFLLSGSAGAKAEKKENNGAVNDNFWGATTVASTMHLAHLAGISTFVTGGTGGVHRGGELSLDISSDLTQLSKTPIVVISAGIKSILDIQRTLEYMETLSIPTATYQSNEYPSFFSPHSGISSPHRVDCATDVAKAFRMSRQLGLHNGMLIAVPNKHPAGESVEKAIQSSLAETHELGIVGKDVTPYILKTVAEKTGGDSLKSNIELVKQNARVGAEIALAIAELESDIGAGEVKEDQAPLKRPIVANNTNNENNNNTVINQQQESEQSTTSTPVPSSKVVVMGGIVMDIIAKPSKPNQKLIPATSNPGICFESDGGVGRNVAEALGRLGAKPLLYSAIGGGSGNENGSDSIGKAMIERLKLECGVLTTPDTIYTPPAINTTVGDDDTSSTTRTATYLAILDNEGDLNVAIADMDIFQHIPIPSPSILKDADILVLDANPPMGSLLSAAKNAVATNTKVFFEPTSVPKATEVGEHDEFLNCLTYAFPNLDELLAMADGWTDTDTEINEAKRDGLKTCKLAAKELLLQMQPTAHIIVTLGNNGVLLCSKHKKEYMTPKELDEGIEFTHFPVKGGEGIVIENATGAGDTLCGAFINSILNGKDEKEAVEIGMEAALLSLRCKDRAISPHLGQ